MVDLSVITAVIYSGSLGNNFVRFKEKNKNVIHQPRSVRIGNLEHSFS